jgi:hypothetical protein
MKATTGRMNKEWLEDLKKFDTDWHNHFGNRSLIIIVFKEILF